MVLFQVQPLLLDSASLFLLVLGIEPRASRGTSITAVLLKSCPYFPTNNRAYKTKEMDWELQTGAMQASGSKSDSWKSYSNPGMVVIPIILAPGRPHWLAKLQANKILSQKTTWRPGAVMNTFNPSIWEAGAGGSLWVHGQHGLHNSEFQDSRVM